ncbi:MULTISPECIES: 3-isopropylmalate dehydratase small subunit [Microbacterium]|uniref:3-isopropylmalate dehydratase small subunit n=1 Tax=Microbacterium wangchenii TaxID=2541726 RepID=A0ABX5SV09_9MICO|nr:MULTISPECIES: 3-isopropylmalate dehydratase small subunit [Microbacterium]MCK6065646.1 3-isopropylmalate dehydratase small subunit [Microbacterium sp. EYE_512]QBR89061.1 3-isopropylmalate dehydratase small subunit [Microbacterium wangchenii]TFV81856.1 3-isopropylmalate dehydratase small subunit [Microbacterium sp. dk485]TXK20781.1 3-isopropylmalate dehydratase small subunit [Microbacterium wangchenii]
MEKFVTHTGVVAPLKRSAVDTDQIIPAVYLKRVTKTGFEDALFANWRQDPDFILNQPAFSAASILVAGADFGTGSSREHAVWALRDYGFRVVLSPKFADIFRGNAGKQGLVTGVITEGDLERIWAAVDAEPGVRMTVDLDKREAEIGDLRVAFDIDDYTRWRLLEGLDDIGLTLRNEDKIAQFEARREGWRPRTLPVR